MPSTFEGDFSPPPGRFAIVAARFNSMITEALLAGCRDAFARHGVAEDRIDVAWVPGSFEIPLVARKLAVLCWHLIVKGEDYAFAQPSLVAHKRRKLELRAGHASARGRKQ